MRVSIKNQLRALPHQERLYFVSRTNSEPELGAIIAHLVTHLGLANSHYGAMVAPENWLHGNISRFLSAMIERASKEDPDNASVEERRIADRCRQFCRYFREKCVEWHISDVAHWYSGIVVEDDKHDVPLSLVVLVEETIEDFSTLVPLAVPSPSLPRTEYGNCIEDHVPSGVLALRNEAFLPVIRPWFQKSLAVPGDIAEFGCFRGMLSVKCAYYVRSLKQDKTAYAFDTFEGFAINDPGGGELQIGAYANNDNAYDDLRRWSTVIPVVPVKGDATQTCKVLKRPMSFVWLDLDMGVLMDPVLQYVRTLCTPQTVIGIDDYGRPETPTIKPWADETERKGIWRKLQAYPEQCVAFYRIGD